MITTFIPVTSLFSYPKRKAFKKFSFLEPCRDFIGNVNNILINDFWEIVLSILLSVIGACIVYFVEDTLVYCISLLIGFCLIGVVAGSLIRSFLLGRD